MYSPVVIGVISIIPGLGFWEIKQYRRGIGAFLIVVGSFVIYYILHSYSWWQPATSFFRYISFTLWIGQMVFAAEAARLINERGNQYIPLDESINFPAGFNRKQRFIYRCRTVVGKQVENGDRLLAAIMGSYLAERKQGISVQFPLRTRYIGITEKELILIELDLLGEPMITEQVPINRVNTFFFQKGILNDTIQIGLVEDKVIVMKIPFQLREETKLLTQELLKIVTMNIR